MNEELIYLDNAATTFPKPEPVYQAMDSFYRKYGGNAGRGANPIARKAAALVDETRILVADWLQAPQVVFSPSATIALNTVIMGARLRAGDVVYVSPFEHNSVLRPLEHLRKTIGISVKVLPFNKLTFACDLVELEKQFRLEPPTLICITQVSNVIGLILPVNNIAHLAKVNNSQAVVLVDGAQAAGLLPLDTSRIDALVFSGHKSFYGPYGIAGIAFGTEWRPEPLIYGGTGTVSESIEMPESGASRFESGSQNISAIAGLNAAVQWLQKTGREAINAHIHVLAKYLVESLEQLPDVTLYLPRDVTQRHGIVSFSVEDVRPQAIENALGARAISVRAGLHCSPWTHEFLNTKLQGGILRLSPAFFNDATQFSSVMEVISSLP